MLELREIFLPGLDIVLQMLLQTTLHLYGFLLFLIYRKETMMNTKHLSDQLYYRELIIMLADFS